MLQPENGTDLRQGEGKPVVCRPYHVTAPGSRIEEAAVRIKVVMYVRVFRISLPKPSADAHPLKAGVVCVFDDFIVAQGVQNPDGQLLPGSQVVDRNRSAVLADAEKQNVKIRILRIAVDTGFPNVCRRAGFQVNA